jgi:hypothetical protein
MIFGISTHTLLMLERMIKRKLNNIHWPIMHLWGKSKSVYTNAFQSLANGFIKHKTQIKMIIQTDPEQFLTHLCG